MITNKQDRQGVRTPADIERKYNLGRMAKLLEQIESPEYSEKLIRMVMSAFGGCAGMNRRIVPLQLIAAGWETIGDNLHSQVVTIDGVNAYHKINLDLSPEQLLKNKNFLLTTKNDGGVVTVYAIGRKPQADLSIQATVTGTGSTLPVTTVDLRADAWETIGEKLHSQDAFPEWVNSYSQIDLDLSVDQLLSFQSQGFFVTTYNDNGRVTAIAIGNKPQEDLSVQAVITGTGANLPVTSVQLSADGWKTVDKKLHSQEVAISGVTPYSKVNLELNEEQLAHFLEQNLAMLTRNTGGVVTVYAVGSKPAQDYTIQATIQEVRV